MAFGDVYGYRTNVTDVVAFAEGDEVANDDYSGTAGANDDPEGDPESFVDLVLTGQSSGGARRQRVPVRPEADAVANEAYAVA